MAHSHYVMDLFYPDPAKPARPRREVLRIVAAGDAESVEEGKRIAGWRKPLSFRIRAISTTARSGDKLIFDSEPADAAPADDEAQAPA